VGIECLRTVGALYKKTGIRQWRSGRNCVRSDDLAILIRHLSFSTSVTNYGSRSAGLDGCRQSGLQIFRFTTLCLKKLIKSALILCLIYIFELERPFRLNITVLWSARLDKRRQLAFLAGK